MLSRWRNFVFSMGIFVVTLFAGRAAETKVVPRHDPPDLLFRRAPMGESARSVVVNLGTNLHVAFDTELCRVHTIWKGGPLNLWGPPYSNAKAPFICDFEGQKFLTTPRFSPWFRHGQPLMPEFKGMGVVTETNEVWFEYELRIDGKAVRVREWIGGGAEGEEAMVRRTFEFRDGVPTYIRYLAAVQGNGYAMPMKISVEPELFRFGIDQHDKEYRVPRAITEENTEKAEPTKLMWEPEQRFFIEIPRNTNAFSFVLSMASATNVAAIASSARSNSVVVYNSTSEARRNSGDEFYSIEHFPLPPEAELIITGIDWLNERDLAVCTWLGEVFIVENATGPVREAKYRRFARGLNEPLGLTVHHGKIYVVQKGELTRVEDTNGDGEADWFACVNDDWGYSGNYHSYSFGPLITAQNEFMVFITGQRGRADLMYQGFALRLNESGVKPFCHGLRVPHGWGTYQGDIFVTDNQGNWIGTCRLNHLEEGKFYGFPSSKPATKRIHNSDEVAPPVLWLPRALSPSASGIETIDAEAFGPFKGQMLIGDFQNSIVMRAFLEKVNGQWQGAVFPFAKGFLSGVNRLSMGADGKVYVGGGKRTWSTAAPKEYSLDRVSYTGKSPFEVSEVRATKGGFELRFTKALEIDPARDAENYLVKQFRYKYHEDYGSPEFDHDGEMGATEVEVENVEVAEDRRTVRLEIPGLKAGFVTSFRLAVNSADDEDLRNDTFYYTLNERPE